MKKKLLTTLLGLSFLASCAHRTHEDKEKWLISKAQKELSLNSIQVTNLKEAISDLGKYEKKNHKEQFKQFFTPTGFQEDEANSYIKEEFNRAEKITNTFLNKIGVFYNSLDQKQKETFSELYSEYSQKHGRRRHRR